jgi:hypothetical protein
VQATSTKVPEVVPLKVQLRVQGSQQLGKLEVGEPAREAGAERVARRPQRERKR